MSANPQDEQAQENSLDQAVAEGGAYEVIRKRLNEQARLLTSLINKTNQDRLNEFGKSDLSIAARTQIRTENNCIARDIVQVGSQLLFGYNVYIGLKKETKVEDVFSVFELQQSNNKYELRQTEIQNTFLTDSQFTKDFHELYHYYKETRLTELTVKDSKLLMGFQISERTEDIRVFRWAVSADGNEIRYIDNRGERDIQLPPAYDFEWITTSREDIVHGRHPHVNILDKIFIETLNGNLTLKIENNTEDGLGIYSEPVEDATQSIDDAEFQFAEIGSLILIRVLPYRETAWRFLVFNSITQNVQRIDAIGTSCVQLPEDHGIVFPGGYYLQSGEHKTFDDSQNKLRFKRVIRSPNGEDVLYVFYEKESGTVGLFPYNMIEKKLQNPIVSHGYARADDGTIILFSSEQEPTRVHPMQIWSTPYFSDEFASKKTGSDTFYGRIGNAELVRGISDSLSICRAIDNQSVSSRVYQEIQRAANKVFDDHYWFNEPEMQEQAEILREISSTAELAIDEFDKVQSIRQQSTKALEGARKMQEELLHEIRHNSWDNIEGYISSLDRLRHQRGHLTTIREYRYMAVDVIDALDADLTKANEELSEKTTLFLCQDNAFTSYREKIALIDQELDSAQTIVELTPLIESLDASASGLDLLSELMSTLKIDDATIRTRIVDSISEIYAKINQSRAQTKHKQKNLGSKEATAQFSAQFKLFSQSITNALSLATSPENCDKQMARLLVQLEELESQFSDFEDFLSDIVTKREEVYETFESHKQQLLDERQRKAQTVEDAATRILTNIERRSSKFTDIDELNTYLASDPLVLKVNDFIQQLHSLKSAVKADDIESRFKALREKSIRILRDKSDIYEGDGNIIKLGPRHRFNVNTQELDLTIIPRGDMLQAHLSGTDYYDDINDPELLKYKEFWNVSLESESKFISRSEFLAGSIIHQAQLGEEDLDTGKLNSALLDNEKLQDLVRKFAAARYKEGYEKGIHDHDATLILARLLPALSSADLLKFAPLPRAIAQVFWANIEKVSQQLENQRLTYQTWVERARSAAQMHDVFASNEATRLLSSEIKKALIAFLRVHPIDCDELTIEQSAGYLTAELGREHIEFVGSKYALTLVNELKRSLNDDSWRRFQAALEKMMGWPAERWSLSTAWFNALIDKRGLGHLHRYIPEAVALINADERVSRRTTEIELDLNVENLLSEHSRIQDRALTISVDDFLQRFDTHLNEFIPNYRQYQKTRQEIIERDRRELRLSELKPRPLSSFVRNKLINESYLPIIGDNLAKQMGTAGESKRTDLMGLLMMISPPGYGKTTLMEYVADRLGLIFMKINCPSLGHDVLSLDPEQAPNATAKKELEKLNLSLEMGNNVMLYLDDIQHTNPEFLQKFISLCDGTRRIEGVWRKETKTYDMRGKKFCVIMAGNPYTESGEVFKIPDMLANRADIYNLGDVLSGMDEQFALSYIENCLTSNPILAPLATREMQDVYLLIDLALGKEVATSELSHQYSGAEINEITEVLKKLFVIRDVVLNVNQQYITSAAQDDKYRTEPSFKLQGSYRNMNKMAEKVSSVMNHDELMQLIDDHYQGEAQLLTKGAEENLLKLGELRSTLSVEEKSRWDQIKTDFQRNQAMGGDNTDTGTLIIGQLVDLVNSINSIEKTMIQNQKTEDTSGQVQRQLEVIQTEIASNIALAKQTLDPEAFVLNSIDKIESSLATALSKIQIVNQPVPGVDKILRVLASTIEDTIFPLVRSMDKKLEIDLRTHDRMRDVSNQLKDLQKQIKSGDFEKESQVTRKPNNEKKK